MIRRHLTPALVLFVVLLACCFSPRSSSSTVWSILAVSLAAAAAGTVLLRLEASWLRRSGFFLLCFAGGLILGAVSLMRMSGAAASASLPLPVADISEFNGRLAQDSSLSQRGDTVLHLALREAASTKKQIAGRARGNVLIFLTGDYRFSLGQELSFRAPLVAFQGTGSEQYLARLERKDVRTTGYSRTVWAIRAQVREWVHRAVASAGYPASALLEALMIGSREDVPERLFDGFRRTGSLHILALSGLHVTVLYAIIAGVLGFMRRQGLKFLLATLVLLFYQFVAGFFPSLLRATVMIVIGGVALLLDRDAEPLNLLSLSGIAILAMDPFQAFSLSFQLSFVALAGMLALGPLLQRPLEGRLPRFILLPLAMSAGAQIATFPLVVSSFGTYYPSGLVAGLFLIPLTTAFLWAGLVWLPVSAVPWLSLHDACARLFTVFYAAIEWCAEGFARLPGVAVSTGLIPWVVGVSVMGMLLLGFLLPPRRKAAHLRAA
jgi:competence protein ComEC